MFDIGGPEFLTLCVLAVLLFGPDRLPDLFRKIARVIRYLRSVANQAGTQMRQEIGDIGVSSEDLDDIKDLKNLNPKEIIRREITGEKPDQ
jgi:sec-independent protein translocase protein TatB